MPRKNCSRLYGLSSSHLSVLTIIFIEGKVSESQGCFTLVTLETAPMEEVSLGTDSLQNVYTFTTEIAGIAASHAGDGGTLSTDQ